MAEETRCPMCSQPNPADAEVCQHCGARLKPLEAPPGSREDEGLPSGEPFDARPDGEEEDWLARIRSEAEIEPTEAEPPDEGEVDQWLDRLEPEAEGEPAEPGFDEEDLSAEAQPAAEIPEWLQRIRSKEDEPAGEQEEGDWLSEFREVEAEGPEDVAPPPEEAVSGTPPPEEPVAATPVEIEAAGIGPAPERKEGPLPEPEELPAELPDEPMPSWLQDVEPVSPPDEVPEQEGEPVEDEELPRVPALIVDAGEAEEPPPPEEPPVSAGVPDWIGEIEPEEVELPAPEEGEVDLAPATLPSWLEAMRPVETFRQVQIEAEEDQSVESVGPLAGLQGVLMAEPVVAMPRSATIGSMQLAVTERQYAQAELLARMVEEEERELPIPGRRRPQITIIRWIIAGALVLATALSVFTGRPHFALPTLEPRELASLYSLVEALPADRPALLVFDYEPGYSGELDAVGGTLIEQIMARKMPIASVTTRPTGSPLAVRAIERLGTAYGYQPGEDVVHLGYLSGGPTAVQLFSIEPQGSIRGGFALPDTMREAGLSAWDTPVLSQVDALSDFGMIVVFSAGTETARVWPEQAKARMDNTPLIMVLSAGAEPMVRPYFEASDPQVNGILTGLSAATAYERRGGQEGLAQDRWSAFGAAMLVAEVAIAAGLGYGIILWWFSRQEQ